MKHPTQYDGINIPVNRMKRPTLYDGINIPVNRMKHLTQYDGINIPVNRMKHLTQYDGINIPHNLSESVSRRNYTPRYSHKDSDFLSLRHVPPCFFHERVPKCG